MFEGYVLVGGDSSRMGTNKFALRLGDKSFSERAVAALQKIAAARICFIIGANQTTESETLLPRDVARITDVLPHKAALGGIYTALAHAKTEWTAIIACDYPFVTGDLFVRLAEIASSVDADVWAVAPIQSDGRVQPLCAIYRTKPCLNAAKQLLKGNKTQPARRLPETVTTRWVEFEELKNLPGAKNFFTNINTREEYLEAQNILQRMQNTQQWIRVKKLAREKRE